jgi:hypothetical protein
VLGGFGLGCGVLWVGSGAVMAVGVVQEEERQRGGCWAHSSSSLPFSWLGLGQRGLGSTAAVSTSMATGQRRTATVIITVNSIFVCQVFDEMPARDLNSNFLKFPLWVISILAKVSSAIFVLKKEHVLQKFVFENRVWSLF